MISQPPQPQMQHMPHAPHVHGPQCSHHAPPTAIEIPRVFWVFSFLSGTFFLRIFLSLPLMAQFYQIYLMMKSMIWNQPMDFYFQTVSSLVYKLPSVYLRQFLGGFTIPFFIVNLFSICYIYNHQIPLLESGYFVEFLIKILIISSLILYIALFFLDPGMLNSKEDKDELQGIMQKRPEIANPRNLCPFCNLPKIARSFHCNFCNSCVAKWEKHSFIINKCIGAGNQIFYLCFQFSFGVLMFSCLVIYFLKKTEKMPHSISGILAFFFILYNTWCSLQEALIETVSIFYNVTSFELHNFRRLNYLWKNKHCEYFNPFDKGPIHNIREAVESIMPSTPSSTQRQDIEANTELPAYNPDEVINWRKAKFFTVMDIPNSPLKEIVLEEMKKFQNNTNGGVVNVNNNKENPFSAPFPSNFPKGRNVQGAATLEKKEDPENEALVSKNEEEKLNPFTN